LERKIAMKIETIKIKDLKAAKYNPRKDLKPEDKEYQKIKKSILKFGYVETIIVNKDLTVIGGHQRLKILEELGYEEIECNVVDLTKDEEKALNIALNNLSGDWDNQKLEDLIAELKEKDFDLDVTGFDEEEIENMLDESIDLKDDNFELEKELKQIEKPIVKLGDIWILGKHRLMCGDSTSKDDVEKLMKNDVAKCIFTSPPYNMSSKMYENYEDNLESRKYIDFNLNVVKLWTNYLKGFLFWNISYNKNSRWEFIEILYKIVKETGLKFMELIVWDKGHGMPITSKEMLTRQYEDILMVGNEEAISEDMELYYLGTTDKKAYFNKKTGKGISNYWRISTENTQLDNHKACFPLELPAKAIELTTNRDDIIIDCFGGSGTTLIAAEKTDRKCYTMELDPVYCDVIIKRWEKLTGKKAKKE
jgi:DNA modification methylase